MLSRIRLKGFKSFASQIALDLGPGVNVIVGPNGSGKSNLAEAIVWALGEQRSGRLRASGMGEVLHAGGRGAQAQIAEVELVLDGAESESDPAELSVSRRLTRAGDAGYSVNGQNCRLMDMQDALAGQGLGPDALAIVRQGQVDALCNSKPMERRAMVEEAAGVAAAKRRRHRAELKLRRIGDSIARAKDLEEELALQGRRLARQAGAANRAKRLDAELAVARRTLLDRRVEAAETEARAIEESRRIGREAVEAARVAREQSQAAVRSLETAREDSGERARDADRLAMVVRAEADRISGRADLARERQVEERERAKRMGQERQEAVARLDELREAAQEAEQAAAAAAEVLSAAEQRAQEAESGSEAARRSAAEARDAATARTSALTRLTQERDELARVVERAETALQTATTRLADQDDAGAEVLARAERREAISMARNERWQEHRAARDAEVEDARAALNAAQERRRTADARLRALPSTDDASETSLGAELVVKPGYERAVAAALGAAADAELVESASDGVSAVDEGAGAAVVPAPARTVSRPSFETEALRESVEECPARVRPHVDRLLADVWLVDDLGAVPDGAAGTFVTEAGHLYRPEDGVILAPAGALAARAARQRAEAEIEAAEEALAGAEQALARTDEGRADISRRVRAAERSAANALRALEAARAEQASRLRRQDEARTQAADAERAIAEGATRGEEIAGRIEALQAEHAERSGEVEAARRASDDAATLWREAQTALADANTATAAARARAAETSAQLAGAEAAAAAPIPSTSEDPLATRAADALSRAAAALAPLVESGQARAAECAAESRRIDAELAEARTRHEQRDQALTSATERAQQAEIDHAVAEERLAEARRAAAEGPELPEDVEQPELPEDPAELDEHVERLQAKREAIGMVNPLAEEEREELEERQSELGEQMEDLEKTSTELRARMDELDEAVAAGYSEVFGVLTERFGEVAEMLFPGGAGRLTEVEDEDGEPGIEIEVVPAGKRARSLGLLSGGEKSLVALAFCLSLAMVRPAPFYLLDEVEAALDDVNLRRFLGLVRKLASQTQFILITHQQPTVEIADTLFGVTMGGEGASQILSRRLNHTVEGPAKPYVRRQLQALPGGRA